MSNPMAHEWQYLKDGHMPAWDCCMLVVVGNHAGSYWVTAWIDPDTEYWMRYDNVQEDEVLEDAYNIDLKVYAFMEIELPEVR